MTEYSHTIADDVGYSRPYRSDACRKSPSSIINDLAEGGGAPSSKGAVSERAFIFTSFLCFSLHVSGREQGFYHGKGNCSLRFVHRFCGFGSRVDRFFAVAIEQGAPHLQQAVSSNAAVAAPAEMNVEVLGC